MPIVPEAFSTEPSIPPHTFPTSPTAEDRGFYDKPEKDAYNSAFAHGMTWATIVQAYDKQQEIETMAGNYRTAVELAGTDALTGLANRRTLEITYEGLQRMDGVLPHPQRRSGVDTLLDHSVAMTAPTDISSSSPETVIPGQHSLLLVDIDRFKDVNDAAGHGGGDAYLQGIARVMRGAVRGNDLVARTGGDEFAVVLPRTDLEGAHVVAEHVRGAIATIRAIGDTAITSSASIGFGQIDLTRPLEENVQSIDQALSAAKEQGRDKVVPVTEIDSEA